MEDVRRELGLEREDLIALAFFLGSDYTPGIPGIGIVNALEILEAFPMKVSAGGPTSGLKKFKDWLEGYDIAKAIDNIQSKVKVDSTQDSEVTINFNFSSMKL